MSHWTVGSFLLAFAGVVALSGALGSLLRRTLHPDRPPRDPMAIVVERTRPRIQGTAAMLVGLAVALVAFPLASRIGLPIHLAGLSVSQSFFAVVLGVGLLALVLGSRGSRPPGR
jgi:hypothetical protein